MTNSDNGNKFHRAAMLTLNGVAVGSISLYTDQFSESALTKLTGEGIKVLLEDATIEAPKTAADKVLVTDKYS